MSRRLLVVLASAGLGLAVLGAGIRTHVRQAEALGVRPFVPAHGDFAKLKERARSIAQEAAARQDRITQR